MLDAAFHAGVIMRAREKLMLLNTPAIAVLLHGCWLFCSVLSLFSQKAPCSGKTTTLGVTGGGKDKKEKKISRVTHQPFPSIANEDSI